MSTLPSAKDGLPPTRRQSTLQIISIAATLLFGVQLLTWGAFVCALRYIAGQFVVASNKNWFLLLFGTVVPLIPLVLSARWLAQTVLENGFPEFEFSTTCPMLYEYYRRCIPPASASACSQESLTYWRWRPSRHP